MRLRRSRARGGEEFSDSVLFGTRLVGPARPEPSAGRGSCRDKKGTRRGTTHEKGIRGWRCSRFWTKEQKKSPPQKEERRTNAPFPVGSVLVCVRKCVVRLYRAAVRRAVATLLCEELGLGRRQGRPFSSWDLSNEWRTKQQGSSSNLIYYYSY
eukprot:scaffold102713_cov32-Tisochrysis_lutea.AAC.4